MASLTTTSVKLSAISSANAPGVNFTKQLSSLKSSLNLWEDVVSKSNKLGLALRTVVQCISSFLEALQKIADIAYTSNCGLQELGSSMTRFCLRERAMEVRLKNFNSQLTDCFSAPLALRLEEWRRAVSQLDRENSKEWQRARSDLLRATGEMDKLQKRFRRKCRNTTNEAALTATIDRDKPGKAGPIADNLQLNFVHADMLLKWRTLAELERLSLRKALVEDRRRFAELMTCLKPVLDCQTSLFSDAAQLEESVSLVLRNGVFDPNELPTETEQAIDVSVEEQLTALTSASSQAEPGRLGVRTLRLLKNFHRRHQSSSSSRLDLSCSSSLSNNSVSSNSISSRLLQSQPTSGGTSVGSAALSGGGAGSLWGAVAANVAALASRGRQAVGTGQGSNLRSRSASPVASENRRDAALSVARKMDFNLGHGDSLSLFEQTSDVSAPRLQHRDGGTGDFEVPPSNDREHVSIGDSPRTVDIRGQSNNVIDPPAAYSTAGGTCNATSSETQKPAANPVKARCHGDGRQGAVSNDPDSDSDDFEDDGPAPPGNGSTDEHLSQEDDSTGSLRQLPETSFLYPNQLLPAPVYTNLSELKRAAARKLSGSQADVSRPVSRLFSVHNGVRADTTSLHGGGVLSQHNGSPLLETGVQDGTSTFGRRQSTTEFPRIGVNDFPRCSTMAAPASTIVDLAGFDFHGGKNLVSVTPGLVRRASNQPLPPTPPLATSLTPSPWPRPLAPPQVTMNGTGPSRPVHPPRRSSSVCRDSTFSRQPNPAPLQFAMVPSQVPDYPSASGQPRGLVPSPVPGGGPFFLQRTGSSAATNQSQPGNCNSQSQPAQLHAMMSEAANPGYALPPLAVSPSTIGPGGLIYPVRPTGPMTFGIKSLPNHDVLVAGAYPMPMATDMGAASRLPMQHGAGFGRHMTADAGRQGRMALHGYHGDLTMAGRMNGDNIINNSNIINNNNSVVQQQRHLRMGQGSRGSRVSSFID